MEDVVESPATSAVAASLTRVDLMLSPVFVRASFSADALPSDFGCRLERISEADKRKILRSQ
jgi:hypothetical protein